MQGVPGSGKSVIAKMIRMNYEERVPEVDRAVIISTDDYRMQPQLWCEECEKHRPDEFVCPECQVGTVLRDAYVFDAEDNVRYHQMTQQECARLMALGQRAIIVDNTNIQEWAARPYLTLADIYGYTIQVVSVDCGLYHSIKRQYERREDRRVPDDVIKDMYSKMERLLT
jgi:tRNA uridine 5-carbamoylmethylation protein Kti12